MAKPLHHIWCRKKAQPDLTSLQSLHERATQPEDGRDNPGPNPLQDRGMTPFPESATGAARGTFAGIGLMLAGTFLFSVNDALGKWLLADYSIGELLLVRSIAGLMLLAPLIRQTGIAGFRSAPRPGLQIVRRAVLPGSLPAAAGRYQDVLSRRADLRDGPFGR